MKKITFLSFLIITLNLDVIAQLAPPELSPGIAWKKSDRLYDYPPNITFTTGQDINEAVEDWWYDHVNSYREGIVSTENFEGFMACGYSDIRNVGIQEDNDGCFQVQIPTEPVFYCNSSLDFPEFAVGMRNNISFQSIARYDPFGKLAWFKTYNANGDFKRIIQTSDGNYIAIGGTTSTREMFDISTPIYYNPGSSGWENAFGLNGIDCNECAFHSKINVVKIDQNGDIIWNYIYGINPIATDEAQWDRYYPWDLVEYDISGTPSIRIVGLTKLYEACDTEVDIASSFMLDIDMITGEMNWETTHYLPPPLASGYSIHWTKDLCVDPAN
jgi:hypothetical protein